MHSLQRCHVIPKLSTLNVHSLPPHPSHYYYYTPQQVEVGVRTDPDRGQHLLLDVGLELVDQPHLLLGPLALHQQELDDARRLVHVDAHGGGLGQLGVHVLAVVPHLVAGAGPAGAPGGAVLPEAARPVLGLPGRALTDHPDHHPAVVVHLPVSPVSQQALLTQHLEQRAGELVHVQTYLW
ncbi:hypothetical protein INR49_030446 [Caranx melampygus]|nr:hypothetical protein INR49_030446 [Caranx melampygus]